MSGTGRSERARVLDVVRRVRRRWRLRVALGGLARAGGATLAVAFLSAFALERLRFDPGAVAGLRWLTWGSALASAWYFLARPLLRRVSDRQAALYLEEHEPSLDHAVASAVDAAGGHDRSPALARRVLETALERARGVEYGRRVEQGRLYRVAGALAGVAVAALVLSLLGPRHLRHGLSALLAPTRDAASVNPYSIAVTPGDATVTRGTDQLVSARLQGFEAAGASAFTRTGPGGSFQRLSMLPVEGGGFEILLLGLSERTEYFVESTGVRSPTYTIEVAELPYVDRLDLTYHSPAYTGLPPRVVEAGGDVAALPGTVVEVRVTPTMPSPGGRLVMDSVPGSPLEETEDGTLAGRFTVEERGFYSIELARASGALVTASPEYTIDVLPDRKPSVRFARPGRDAQASPIEEVYLEVGADDDYGIGDVRLVYSVNGGTEDTLTLFEDAGPPLPRVSVGHTLFLEEWALEPGDLVSYYALVRDNRDRRSGEPVASDMYFVNVRPFERSYRQGEQQGGGAQQGGGQAPESALSELQRQVIAATFNLVRQRDSYASEEFSENVVSVALTQGRLREQVSTLVQRMVNRGLTDTDPGFRDVSTILPKATEAMDSARRALDDEKLRDALPHEQSALRYLQQAEETYERYVVRQAQGGGGGGGSPAAAEELADLFELELDKLKNQYETVRRGQRESADAEVDEMLEKLKELARRQEQEAERQRRRAAQAAAGAPRGGGGSQRELAEETEEAARQLQRLARETGNAELEEAARRLERAAEAMRRSAARDGAAAGAGTAEAMERIEEARRRLERNREDRARRDARDGLREVDDLIRQQREVQRDVRELPESGRERASEIERLTERKNQMTEAVQGLERQIDRAASDARADRAEAARALKEAADGIRESKLKEKLQYSRGTIREWDPRSATTLELDIEADLQTLRERLERAADAAGEREVNPIEAALDSTRSLVRGIEAMDRRLRDASEAEDERGEGVERGEPGDGDRSRGEGGEPGARPGDEGRPGEGDHSGDARRPGEEAGAGEEGGRRGGAAGGGPERPGEGGERGGLPGDSPSQPRGERSSPFGGATRGDPRSLSPEEIRQYAREFGRRADQVRGLQNQLREAGRPAGDLQAVLDAMERLEREGLWNNPAQVAGLNEEILESLKRLEFGLRREVEGEADRKATLTASDEVPPGYRKLVEEYYKALARSGRGGR